MPRMTAPYTGVVFDVYPANVEKRLARGFALLDTYEPPATESEPEPEAEPEGEPEALASDVPRPDSGSTIAEIREWAAAHGVELPKRGNKAELLAAIEGA